MKYTIATARSPSELEASVNNYIAKGYAPHGSMIFASNHCIYCQPMVKPDAV